LLPSSPWREMKLKVQVSMNVLLLLHNEFLK
jgi:hypothetical protein